MGQVIAVGLRKGGVGKSTTVVNLGVVLAQKYKKKVLLIDMDPQGHLALSFALKPNSLNKTIYDVFTEESTVNDTIIKTEYKVYILPSNKNLNNFDMLAICAHPAKKVKREHPCHVLKRMLHNMGKFD